jgi:hypothetical protein
MAWIAGIPILLHFLVASFTKSKQGPFAAIKRCSSGEKLFCGGEVIRRQSLNSIPKIYISNIKTEALTDCGKQ